MRTTLTLEDDIAGILKDQSHQLGVSFKEIVNQTLRKGLEPSLGKRKKPPKIRAHSFGFKPGIDFDKMNQLADELEAESFLESWNRQIK